MTNLASWYATILQCIPLEEKDVKILCVMVIELMIEESNIQPVNAPVNVCGDLHGQFFDLIELFNVGGQVPDKSYIFMGDFVDRGFYSLETITLLFVLKALYPDRVTLTRGNHESREISKSISF